MRYSAILFDLDGTLVDTITLYEKAFLQVLRDRGHQVSEKTFREWYMQGVHLREIASILGFSEEDIPQIRIERDTLYEELLRTESSWIPGATIALAMANAACPVGIVTGSWLSYLKAMRSRTDIFPFAKAVVTADDIHMFMKPHPHGLLVCADRLQVEPSKCIYIGDQTIDIEAANAAGMTSCLIRGTHTPDNAHKEAAMVLDSLEMITEVL